MSNDVLDGRIRNEEIRKYEVKPWQANLETDLMEFCYKEGIRPYRSSVGYMFKTLYDAGKAKTIRELLCIPKLQYLSYAPRRWTQTRKDMEWLWETTNKRLMKHGYRMYTRAVVINRKE